VWECGKGQRDTQMGMTSIHFALAIIYVKFKNNKIYSTLRVKEITHIKIYVVDTDLSQWQKLIRVNQN